MQCLALLCHRPMATPLIKNSADGEGADIRELCKLFICDVNIYAFRVDMSLSQIDERLRNAIFS